MGESIYLKTFFFRMVVLYLHLILYLDMIFLALKLKWKLAVKMVVAMNQAIRYLPITYTDIQALRKR